MINISQEDRALAKKGDIFGESQHDVHVQSLDGLLLITGPAYLAQAHALSLQDGEILSLPYLFDEIHEGRLPKKLYATSSVEVVDLQSTDKIYHNHSSDKYVGFLSKDMDLQEKLIDDLLSWINGNSYIDLEKSKNLFVNCLDLSCHKPDKKRIPKVAIKKSNLILGRLGSTKRVERYYNMAWENKIGFVDISSATQVEPGTFKINSLGFGEDYQIKTLYAENEVTFVVK